MHHSLIDLSHEFGLGAVVCCSDEKCYSETMFLSPVVSKLICPRTHFQNKIFDA